MRKPTCFALPLALAVAAQAGNTSVNPVPFNRPLPTPLYEEYPVIGDFRFNQTVESSIRWASLGLVLGGIAGTAFFPDDDLGIMAFLGVATGGVVGLASGATVGYLRGRDWEIREAGGETLHARRKTLGYEVDIGAGLAQNGFRDGSHFALSWRLPVQPRWAPDEYQLLAGSQAWEAVDQHGGHATDDRYGFRALKSFRDALINPFVGVGGGYSRGKAFTYPQPVPALGSETSFGTAYAEALAGVEINAFDFFHARIQAAYEPFGPYRVLQRHGDYDYASNFSLRASLGASLF